VTDDTHTGAGYDRVWMSWEKKRKSNENRGYREINGCVGDIKPMDVVRFKITSVYMDPAWLMTHNKCFVLLY
jgi:hypothetical protein